MERAKYSLDRVGGIREEGAAELAPLALADALIATTEELRGIRETFGEGGLRCRPRPVGAGAADRGNSMSAELPQEAVELTAAVEVDYGVYLPAGMKEAMLTAALPAIRSQVLEEVREGLLSIETTRPLAERLFGDDWSVDHIAGIEAVLTDVLATLNPDTGDDQ